jgi:hypothetical protein
MRELKIIEHSKKNNDLFQMVENICVALDAHHEIYCLFAV